eukprot:6205756-Pleurochrysis_carterae.AAC.1
MYFAKETCYARKRQAWHIPTKPVYCDMCSEAAHPGRWAGRKSKAEPAAVAEEKKTEPSTACPVKSGVVVGDDLLALFKWAKEQSFAIPAVNYVASSSVNAVLESAAKSENPVIVQVSQGGGAFYCGKGIKDDGYKATIAGSIALAKHVRAVAPMYDVPVVIHSDHCAKNWYACTSMLPRFDGMLAEDEEYFAKRRTAIFLTRA